MIKADGSSDMAEYYSTHAQQARRNGLNKCRQYTSYFPDKIKREASNQQDSEWTPLMIFRQALGRSVTFSVTDS